MDGEHNEKPGYIIPMDLGVFPLFLGWHPYGNTPINGRKVGPYSYQL